MLAKPRRATSLAIDVVLLTIRDGQLAVLLVRRAAAPFKGDWALPGGLVREDEDLLDAAERELADKTGTRSVSAHFEQLRTYGSPGRDPRGRVVTVVYLALIPEPSSPTPGSNASAAAWHVAADVLADSGGLAFDHTRILRDGVERARAKLEYSTLATALCRDEFTISDLRRVYEAVWGAALDPRNFHRKITATPGFVVETGGTTVRDGGRPAQLYRPGAATVLHPALLRPAAGSQR